MFDIHVKTKYMYYLRLNSNSKRLTKPKTNHAAEYRFQYKYRGEIILNMASTWDGKLTSKTDLLTPLCGFHISAWKKLLFENTILGVRCTAWGHTSLPVSAKIVGKDSSLVNVLPLWSLLYETSNPCLTINEFGLFS